MVTKLQDGEGKENLECKHPVNNTINKSKRREGKIGASKRRDGAVNAVRALGGQKENKRKPPWPYPQVERR